MAHRSAVIVPIALPRGLWDLRGRADATASRGVPPHVTVLFPFMPAGALTPQVQAALSDIAAEQRPFTVSFDGVMCREGMVWLLPADQRPFIRLTADVEARWPGYPPYEGMHAELIAHLTLVETSQVEVLDAACAAASRAAGFGAAAEELRVIVEDATGRWHARWRLPFGPAGVPPRLDA